MKPKIKTGISAIMIIGWIFAGLGSVFLIMGILFLTQSGKEEAFKMLGLIFGGTGLFFFLIGVIFLILHYNNKSSLKKIVDNGYYIMAEISNIDMNYNVNVNGRCPYVIYARYQDMNGCIHTFHSRNIFFYPAGMMKNNMVKIYTRPDNFKKYYMDVDEILPEVQMH